MGRRLGLAFGLAAALSACGGGSSDSGSTCTPGGTAAFTIGASGVSPGAVCVLPGGAVTFTNTDTVAHSVASSDAVCPALDLGAIDPSGSKTATLPSVATCRFRDPNAPTNTAFQGVVAVTLQTVSGGGGGGGGGGY